MGGRNAGLPENLRRYRITSGTPPERWPDDSGCGVLHVDMDAFFAAVELRSRPELVDCPVVVAATSGRAVVLSANYPARRYGIHSAMPMAQARARCAELVVLPPTRGSYSTLSRAVRDLFAEYTPLVEPLSLDEAFLDVGGALRRLDSTPARIAAEIRARVHAEHRISCSVGVAGVKFVAKLASGMAKPDGMVVVPGADQRDFLHPLPASALYGVGARTEESLSAAGLRTIGDVAGAPLRRLTRAVGTAMGEHLHALANGHDPREVTPERQDKSLSAEHTFETDQTDQDVLATLLLDLADRVAAGLRRKELRASTVAIKVRYRDFTTITRSRTLPAPTDVAREIAGCARELLAANVGSGAAVRLLGVRADGLTADAAQQLTLTAADEPSWRAAEVAADVARDRFGAAAVRSASLLPVDRDEPDMRSRQARTRSDPGSTGGGEVGQTSRIG